MRKLLLRLVRARAGATAIEYGLIAALIAVVTIAGLTTLGTNLNSKYNTIAQSVSGAG
ncbi:MAG TPA: Flp family type IVb pilin [Stellaceae bacterium]|nr:Flp family type IVb pilin [Stellaceae bacterium]